MVKISPENKTIRKCEECGHLDQGTVYCHLWYNFLLPLPDNLATGNYSVFKAESSHESAQVGREWYRTFEFPDFVPRDVNPDDNDWYEIFKDYTMICQL